MLEIKPFAAVRYDFARFGGDLSRVVAPPYDVLDQRDKDALLARSDRNIVAIDLPHVPPKSAGPPAEYQRAAELLQSWLADGTLILEPFPSLYVYHQQFESGGCKYNRRMLIARVRLEPFEAGVILPHERTFGGPKEDRLALMKATHYQTSPIFGLYSDPGNQVALLFSKEIARPPDATATLDAVLNLLWVVTDKGLIDAVARQMATKKLYIADGHHRYGTALLYRDWVRESHGGRLPPDCPANFVMFVLASMDDPGCLILPYYRVLGGVSLDTLIEAWRGATQVVEEGNHDLILWDGASGKQLALKYTQREVLPSLEPNQVPPWHKLDYVYLHRYLIEELLVKRRAEYPRIEYVKSLDEAKAIAKAEHGVALLVNPTPMAHLRAVSEAGGLMPQKSTYFYPKLATGLILNPLE